MADLMSQNEIDQLLKSAIGGSEAEEAKDSDQEIPSEIKKSPRAKTYSYQKRKDLRFSFPYQSPVVKQEQYIFNPHPQSKIPEGAVVVRTLNNYLDYAHKKKQQMAGA